MRGRTRRFALAVVCSASMGMLATPAASAAAGPGAIAGPVAAAEARTGHDIYRQFRDGLSAPACPAGVSERWRTHFAAAPGRLAQPDPEVHHVAEHRQALGAGAGGAEGDIPDDPRAGGAAVADPQLGPVRKSVLSREQDVGPKRHHAVGV